MRLIAATVLSGVLWLFGTGLHPVAALTWLAPLPVLILALRAGPGATVAAAAGSWLIGQAGIVPYYLNALELPVVLVTGVVAMGAVLFAATAVTARSLIRRGRTLTAVAAAPAVWVLGEYLVSRVLPHGAWWSLGYTQADHRAVIQVAAVTGVWGLTFLLLAVPVAVAAGLRPGEWRAAGAALLVPLLLAGGWSAWSLAAVAGTPDRIRAGLVALPQNQDPVPVDTPAGATLLARYQESVTALGDAGARVIVLPEKVFRVTPSTTGVLARALAHRTAEVVIGVQSHHDGAVTNEAMMIGPGGAVLAGYRKQHLIPGLESWMTPGHERVVVHGRLGLAVCKDLDFPDLVRGYARSGATILLVPSWDFGDDGRLHSRMALLRGVESGVTVVRAARGGHLTVSDPTGRILPGTAAGPAVSADVALSGGGQTPYARLGDWFPLLCALVLALSVAQVGLRRRLPPAAEHDLPRAVSEELDPGQLPAGEFGLDGELRRRGQPIDV